MAFNLQTFEKILGVAQVATQEAATIVSDWGSGDHVGAVATAVQTAGAIAQSSTTDTQSQAEASVATQLAIAVLPAIFAFAQLFAKSKK
jgi:hypothetical protein